MLKNTNKTKETGTNSGLTPDSLIKKNIKLFYFNKV